MSVGPCKHVLIPVASLNPPFVSKRVSPAILPRQMIAADWELSVHSLSDISVENLSDLSVDDLNVDDISDVSVA